MVERIRQRATAARTTFGDHISEFREQWTDHHAEFCMKVLGMKTTGTIAVEPETLRVSLELPLAALLVRGAIEGRVRQELEALVRG
jgi:hypothetical protein